MAVLDQHRQHDHRGCRQGRDARLRLKPPKDIRTIRRGRPDDSIGLVVFANYPDRVSPLTLGTLISARYVVRPSNRRTERHQPRRRDRLGARRPRSLFRPRKKVLILLSQTGKTAPLFLSPVESRNRGSAREGTRESRSIPSRSAWPGIADRDPETLLQKQRDRPRGHP